MAVGQINTTKRTAIMKETCATIVAKQVTGLTFVSASTWGRQSQLKQLLCTSYHDRSLMTDTSMTHPRIPVLGPEGSAMTQI